ncbi:hypothetical protein CSKR_201618 [Clonorchis sinensis]|uniref:Uncharacterized protein n=1 Tax=Clonorchis sinensis TaxID=79923 RepID=A0A8T1MTL2_CLOSI|nr:hypothetical protein CSKR_201618 [Clonorchis sinensis]
MRRSAVTLADSVSSQKDQRAIQQGGERLHFIIILKRYHLHIATVDSQKEYTVPGPPVPRKK